MELVTRNTEQNNAAAVLDNLDYDYAGNQLTKVTDTGLSLGYDFGDGANLPAEYLYDNNGNMTRDENKGITNITYNYLNLPTVIDFGGNNKIEYTYTSTGAKLRKEVFENGTLTLVKGYVGSFVYTGNTLEFLHTAEGRALSNGDGTYTYEYYLKDHLGNTRVSFDENSVTVKQEDHYYPFGMRLGGGPWVQAGTGNKFLYNGKELEDDLGLNWYHYGARFYDPQLGRWHSVDPADFEFGPYNYSLNSPVLFIDPDGSVPFIFYIRSYHPDKWFGWPARSPGDSRGPSTSLNVTSRITHIFTADAAAGTLDSNPPFSDPSILYPFGFPFEFSGQSTPEGSVDIISKGVSGKYNTLELKQWYSSKHGSTYGTVFENMTPAIDIRSHIVIQEATNKIIVTIVVGGDGFPNSEIFIEDQIGNRIMLDIYKILPWQQPLTSLPGNGAMTMMEAVVEIQLDNAGNFSSTSHGQIVPRQEDN